MDLDITKGTEAGYVSASTAQLEHALWHPKVMVEKWDADQTEWVKKMTDRKRPQAKRFYDLNVKPVDYAYSEGNLLTTAGLTRLTNLLTAGGGTALTNTTCRIGTGNGAGSAAVGDTDLSASAGAANRWFQIMDATFPSVAAAVITFKSTFASGDGNYAWNEWGIDIGTATVTSAATVNATFFNHKTSAALGTKASGSTWAFTVTVTFS